jgi:eukaryotic-like serine/threonine-protein kinase
MALPNHVESAIEELLQRYSLPAEARIEIARLLDRPRDAQSSAPSTIIGEAQSTATAGYGHTRSAAPTTFGDFELQGVIGEGGTSTVVRLYDLALNRTVAAKLLRQQLMRRHVHVQRFLDESRLIAQLDHPGIIPIYQTGRLETLQPYYIMREVHGQTLAALIRDVHDASGSDGWRQSCSGWSLHRLVEAFQRVCETVAYAHSRGVIHRDLKPSNVMVGKFGEVYTLDFGLAKVLEAADREDPDDIPSRRQVHQTLTGVVIGTPAYMAPEQARGDTTAVGPLADIYSLGATLYEILVGRPPYEGTTSADVLHGVLAGEPPLPAQAAQDSGVSPPVPAELQSICLRAMARDPGGRYPDASSLAIDLAAWFQGTRRREAGLRLVEQADQEIAEVTQLRERAAALRAEAQGMLMTLPPFISESSKAPAWRLEDEATRLDRTAGAKEVEFTQRLRSALSHAPDLPEAHARLADYFRGQHAAAEEARRESEAARLEVSLRAHEHGRQAAYLRGTGTLTLVTDPPGATVDLMRYEPVDRRSVEQFVRSLGVTPLAAIELPIGSYLLIIRSPGHADVRYPVRIERLKHWDGVPPWETDAASVRLPPAGTLGPDEVYVPAGAFISGGDPEALNGLPYQRWWVDGFVMDRFPVSNAQYLAFLNDLSARGQIEEALRWAPRERGGAPGQQGALICERDDDGRFVMRATAAHVPLLPDLPVCMVDWAGAAAYSRWRAERDGLPWRLPGEIEWEKAARGVDGRSFPWGDFLDPSWCLMRLSHAEMGRAFLAGVDSYPADCSPYGVRGMAGNARDWCFDAYQPMGPRTLQGRPELSNGEDVQGPGAMGAHRVYRGGAWRDGDRACRVTFRDAPPAYFRDWDISFRLVRPWPTGADPRSR